MHLLALLAVLAVVQAPRLGGAVARLAAPVFPEQRRYVDFELGYYPAAQTIRHDPAQLYQGVSYDPSTGHLEVESPARFVNLPLVAWLFAPFTLLPVPAAGTLLLLLNGLIALACLFLLQRRAVGASPLQRWAITAAFATSGPLLNALDLGQSTPLILLWLLLAERSLARQHDARAGVWLGLACLVKIPLLLLVPYLALRRRWRVVGGAAALLLLASGVSVLCYGWPLHVTFFNVVIRGNFGTVIAAHNSQSVGATVARLMTRHSLLSWQPIELSGAARLMEQLVVVGLLGLCGWTLTARGGVHYQRMLLELSMVVCVGLLVVPVSWVHYGTWLLPVAVVVGAATARPELQATQRRNTALLILAVLLINAPVLPFSVIRSFADAWWFRLAMSRQTFGTGLLFALCVWRVRHLGNSRGGCS